MSTFAYMKLLESSATRYDRLMRVLSGGRIDRLHARMVERLAGRGRVLDLGTGTGAIALACARGGAQVVGIDRSAEMLDVARRKIEEAGLGAAIELHELTVTELEDVLAPGSFDAVSASLVLSELDPAEQDYALRSAHRMLAPGGLLVIGEEVSASGAGARLWQRIRRSPWVLVGGANVSAPVDVLPERIARAGFVEIDVEVLGIDTVVVTARREGGSP